jgi:hypothetical protein
MATIYSKKLTLASDTTGIIQSTITVSDTFVQKNSNVPIVMSAPSISFTNTTTDQIIDDVVGSYQTILSTIATNKATGLYLLDAETANRVAGDVKNAADLSTENATRVAQGVTLSSAIAAESAARAALLAAESAARVAAVADAQSLLDAEIAARIVADQLLDTKVTDSVSAASTALLTEVDNRIAGDLGNQVLLDSKYAQIMSSITDEASALVNSTSILQGKIDLQVAARVDGVNVQKTRVDEIVVSLGVDEAALLQTVAAYTAADVSIQTQITNLTNLFNGFNYNFNLLKTKVDNALTTST